MAVSLSEPCDVIRVPQTPYNNGINGLDDVFLGLRQVHWEEPHTVCPSNYNSNSDTHILTLMLLAFTKRHMMRSAHLALSPKRFNAQHDFAVSDIYSYKKIHTASSGTARLAVPNIQPSPEGSGLMW